MKHTILISILIFTSILLLISCSNNNELQDLEPQELERQFEELNVYTGEFLTLQERVLQHQMIIYNYTALGDYWANSSTSSLDNGLWTDCISSCIKSSSYFSDAITEANIAKALWERMEELLLNEIMPRRKKLYPDEDDQLAFEKKLHFVENMIGISNVTVRISYLNIEMCSYTKMICEDFEQEKYDGLDLVLENFEKANEEIYELSKMMNEYKGKLQAWK